MFKKIHILNTSFIVLLTLTACSKASFPLMNNQASAMTKSNPASDYHNSAFLQGNPTTIWYKLQQTSSTHLTEMESQRDDLTDRGWIELALINKHFATNTTINKLPEQLIAWRSRYPNHPANVLLPDESQLQNLKTNNSPAHLAILLPQSGRYAASSRKIREGILNAYYANSTTKQHIKFYDTAQAKNIVSLYQKAATEGADFVIGPLTKNEVGQIRQAGNFTVPVIALNYSDSGAANSKFYEFGLMPDDEVKMAAERAYQEGLAQAIVIAPNNEWGRRLAQSFTGKWQSLGGSVQDTWLYQSRATFNNDIAKLLKVDLKREANNKEILVDQRRQDFNVIFLFAQSNEARLIVPLLRYYYANDVPIYASSSVFAGRVNAGNDNDLDGVTICDIPWDKQPASTVQGRSSNRFYAIGQDAYTLSHSLPTLATLNNFPLYGKTGALSLSNNQQIHRRLPCRVIRHGAI